MGTLSNLWLSEHVTVTCFIHTFEKLVGIKHYFASDWCSSWKPEAGSVTLPRNVVNDGQDAVLSKHIGSVRCCTESITFSYVYRVWNRSVLVCYEIAVCIM
jgi:hypothetical protein